ncbi:MAG TPA: ribosomal protein S18-alanine N-acetyltransferase [Acetobacteraceae bacterium]|jgi:ribosomal-protein-alanine N-acetyltransferase
MIAVGVAHAAALAAIHAASFPAEERWTVEAMAQQLAQPGVFGFVDPDGGMVLGRVAADEAEILTLAVAPSARRQGRGRALLEAAFAEMTARAAAKVFLEVSTANTGARALYAAVGFTEIGRRRRYYHDGADALLMRRDLALSLPGAAPAL